MIEQIAEALSERDVARNSLETINQQIRQAAQEVETAQSKIDAMQADDTASLADLGKAVAEQSAIVEIGKQRIEKLKARIPGLPQSATSAEHSARQLVTMAFDKLTSFRRHKAMHEISKEICARVSPATKTDGNTRLWLKKMIYDLSAHDASLDRISMLVSSGFPGARQERRVTGSALESDVQYVTEYAAELAEAIEWDQARRDAINANPRPAGFNHDPVEDTPIYGNKAVF